MSSIFSNLIMIGMDAFLLDDQKHAVEQLDPWMKMYPYAATAIS